MRSQWTSLLIYIDFDEDDVINGKDLKEVINRLTGDQALNDEEMEQLIQNVRKLGKKKKIDVDDLHSSVYAFLCTLQHIQFISRICFIHLAN